MCASVSSRIMVVAFLVPSAIALAGCGPSTGASSNSSPSASAGSCSQGDVPAQIGGQPKCLQNGQQCQAQNASDYRKYGFVCTKNKGRYELKSTAK
jgi:hypothetical protein